MRAAAPAFRAAPRAARPPRVSRSAAEARGPSSRGGFARRALAALLALAFAAAGAAAVAQDGDAPEEDPFAEGAFEAGAGLPGAETSIGGGSASNGGSAAAATAPVAATGISTTARTEYLVGGTVAVSASGWFGPGLDGYAAAASASGKLFAKVSLPEAGSLYASYSLRQAFLKALSGDDLSAFGRAESLSEPDLGLAELHYSFDLGKKVFLRLGKQLLSWGPSFVWTPVDFVNAEKADLFASVDTREGKSGLKILIPLGTANVFAFTDFSDLVEDSNALALGFAERGSYALRAEAVLGGFELGLTGHWGPERQAEAGFDFSGHLLGLAAHGEIAVAPGYSDFEGLLQASAGFSRALGDLRKWTISAEGFFNSAGKELSSAELAAAVASGEATFLYVGRWYAYAALKAEDLFFAGHDATLSAVANLSDLSFRAALAQDFEAKGAPPFSLSIAYLGGGGGKEFTYASGDGAFELTLRTKLEF